MILGQKDPVEKKMATKSVFLLGDSHGQKSLVGDIPQGWKGLDTIETTYHAACILNGISYL